MFSTQPKEQSPLANSVEQSAISGLAIAPDSGVGNSQQGPGLTGSQDISLATVDQAMAAYSLTDYSVSNSSLASNLVLDSTATLSNTNRLLNVGDGNNTLNTAIDLDSLTGIRVRQGHVGGTDTHDYYRFDLDGVRDLTLSLTGVNGRELAGDLDIRLIHDANNNGQVDSGEIIASSTRSGNNNESLNKVLAGGTYFAQVKNYGGSSGQYEFRSRARLPEVTVDISRVRALNSNIDNFSQADFYSKISIDGSTHTTNYVSNDNDISPNWSYRRTVDGNSRYVDIDIQMWDSDGGFNGADDRIDIDSQSGLRDINVRYDLLTNQITGDVSGSGGNTLTSAGNSGDRAQTWFKVTEGDWYDRNLGDNHLTNLTRNSGGTINRSEMMTLLRETKDGSSVTSTELADLRTIVDRTSQPEHVNNLADKVVNGDAANTRSGIGNLYAGASATRMESLVGKWFMGNDRPDISSGSTYRYVSGSLFQADGISADDVSQGAAGDCYFMTSLSAAAHDKPHVISNMFTDNEDGTFTVRFFKPDGSRDYVTVDRYLATTGSGNRVYAGWGGGANTEADNELWAALAEKAYAQVNESGWLGRSDNSNSYTAIEGGWMEDAMAHISGYGTTSRNATNMSRTELVNLVNSNKMLTVGFVNGTIPGVVDQHAYTITSYNSQTGLFHLDNPWGNTDANVSFAQLQQMQGWVEYTNV